MSHPNGAINRRQKEAAFPDAYYKTVLARQLDNEGDVRALADKLNLDTGVTDVDYDDTIDADNVTAP